MPNVQGLDAAQELQRSEDEFFASQFDTLRKEIEEAKKRVFQSMGVGLIIVPGSQLLQGLKTIAFAPAVNLFLPLLVMVASLVYLSESSAILRCGSYIREHIESRYTASVGWEKWLESDPDHRGIDVYLARAFQSLFVFYYLVSVWIGMDTAFELGNFWALVAALIYATLGVLLIAFLVHNSRVKTSLRQKRAPEN